MPVFCNLATTSDETISLTITAAVVDDAGGGRVEWGCDGEDIIALLDFTGEVEEEKEPSPTSILDPLDVPSGRAGEEDIMFPPPLLLLLLLLIFILASMATLASRSSCATDSTVNPFDDPADVSVRIYPY